MFDFPGTSDDRRLGVEDGAPPKQICILPFPFQEVLLQGETKQLRLYEERFIELFEDCMESHAGVVGMGLLADSGIIQTIPLCEIEAYNRMGEGFGIFVTIRVVGRAKLLDLTQQEPYIKAVCTEVSDELPPNLDLPNLVASNIENYMLLLSSMEHRLSQATEESNDDEDNEEMQRRINVAKLVSNIVMRAFVYCSSTCRKVKRAEEQSFIHICLARTVVSTFCVLLDIVYVSKDDRFFNDDDDDDDEENDSAEPDRRARFMRAYKVAMDTDTQGYFLSTKQDSMERTPQELTAISWAAFCTELLEEEDATFRIQALDSEVLLDRLKLASHMLQQKKATLQKKMEKAGLRGDDEEGGDLLR